MFEEYIGYGWSCVPLPLKSKIPVIKWKHLQERLPLKEEWQEWAKEKGNIAIVTGSLSGICVIDVDEFSEEANEVINQFPVTWAVETGTGGLHYYFKYPKDKELRNFTKRIAGVDFRGEGGYVLGPNSIHPNGNKYKWVHKTDSTDDIADFPFELLKGCFSENGSNKPKVVEILREEQIPEGERNDALYIIAQQIHTAFPKEKSLAWQLFNSFAKDKCASTYQIAYGKGEIGSIFNSASKSRIAAESLSQHENLHRPGSWLNPISAATLIDMDFPPTKWLIDTLLPEESVGMLSGDPASFKTWLLLDLAIKVATGELWLRQFKTSNCGVWLIDKESTISKLNERLKLLNGAKLDNLKITSDQILTVHQDGKMWEQTLEKAADMGIKLIIMDSFRRFIPGSENDSEVTNRFFNNLFKCRSFGISVLFSHHHRKRIKEGPSDATSMIRGSSDILACLDSHLVLEKATEGSLLRITPNKIKDGEAPEPFAIKVEKDSVGKFLFSYTGKATAFQFDTKPKEQDKAAKYILDTLRKEPLGMYKVELQDYIVQAGYSNNAFTEAFTSLRKQGQLKEQATGLPGQGQKFKYMLNGSYVKEC